MSDHKLRATLDLRRMLLVGRYLRIRKLLHWPASEAHRERLIARLVRAADPEIVEPD